MNKQNAFCAICGRPARWRVTWADDIDISGHPLSPVEKRFACPADLGPLLERDPRDPLHVGRLQKTGEETTP